MPDTDSAVWRATYQPACGREDETFGGTGGAGEIDPNNPYLVKLVS
mgnify:FL=1